MPLESISKKIEIRLRSILAQELTKYEQHQLQEIGSSPLWQAGDLVGLLSEDLTANIEKNPATKGKADIVLESSSFAVIMYYRLANYLWRANPRVKGLDSLAMRISDAGKRHSGVEIHYAAKIGRRFILDHSQGTVIGETCEIGDDCYILGGVILGAYGISGNPIGKRHPTLGNNVQIGSSARILGPICVGNDVFISPNCVVTNDVPSGTQVTIVNQVQIQKSTWGVPTDRPKVFGVLVKSDGMILLCKGFKKFSARIVDVYHNIMSDFLCLPIHLSDYLIELKIQLAEPEPRLEIPNSLHLLLEDQGHEITILNPVGLTEMLSTMILKTEEQRHE